MKEKLNINTLKNEHLKNPKEDMVMTAIDFNRDRFRYNPEYWELANSALDVNFYLDYSMSKKGFENLGDKTFVFSPIDTQNKRTDQMKNCTSIIAFGKRNDNKNVSFISHQDPYNVLKDNKEEFETAFRKKIEELKKISTEGSIDIVIVGGNSFKNSDFEQNYIDTINLLTKYTIDNLGFEPTIASGPNTNPYDSDQWIVVDTEHRRIYLNRPEPLSSNTTQPYIGGDVQQKNKEWTKE